MVCYPLGIFEDTDGTTDKSFITIHGNCRVMQRQIKNPNYNDGP